MYAITFTQANALNTMYHALKAELRLYVYYYVPVFYGIRYVSPFSVVRVPTQTPKSTGYPPNLQVYCVVSILCT